MASSKGPLSETLLSLENQIRQAAHNDSGFARRLNEKNLTVQIKLRDDSAGRSFTFRDGALSCREGIHAGADLTVAFHTAELAARLLKPDRSQLDFLNAVKSFQLLMEGPDELAVWFTETLCMIRYAGKEIGTDLGGGVRRYTSNTNGGPLFVEVRDDKILRITPIEFDESDAASWTIEAHGKTFTPPRKTTVSPHTMAWKSMVYSSNRILHPMKRVDFDPKGERNPQNRGVSGYERISWDEALEIVTDEILRVKRDYGPGAVMFSSGSHHTWGNLGYFQSARNRFFNLIGATTVVFNPDSWEGWAWGAVHHWGYSAHNGGGETYGTVEDLLKNAEMVVFWSCDPEATGGVYGAHEGTIRRQWLKDLGIPCVHIDPYYNHTAAWIGGKWLSPRPGSDSAMVLAIAYVWMTEGLYDKQYVAEKTVGFEKWREHVLGLDDGVPKTPEWQEKETTVPARDVRALAREWGTKRTYLGAGGLNGFGAACRTATGTDWARGMVCLMAMQGLGKPGVNIGCLQQGSPVDTRFYFPGYSEGGLSGDLGGTAIAWQLFQRMPQLGISNPSSQRVPRLKIPEAIMDGRCEGYPTDPKTIEGQFFKFQYPAPGHSKVKLYYKYGGSNIGTMPNSNRYVRMYRTDDLECVVSQAIWLEGETKFADVILPACTNFERWDISEFANCSGYIHHSFTQCNHRVAVLQHKCIEPLGESKSDLQIFLDLSKRMGLGFQYSEGSTELDWCRRLFEATDLPVYISWEEFLKKGYFVVPAPAQPARDPVSFRWFAEGRPKDTPEPSPLPGSYCKEFRYGLQTQSGKIEFESSSLKRFCPDDPDRLPILKYVPAWEGPHVTDLWAKYPLHLVCPHPRFTFHTQSDAKDSTINDIKDHRMLIDGFYYWIARINRRDAADRGIRDNDLVKLFNDRGTVICAAQLTERVPPGMVHSYEASAIYEPLGEPGQSPDRGGCINQLTPHRMVVEKSHAMAPCSCLIEVAKWEFEGGYTAADWKATEPKKRRK